MCSRYSSFLSYKDFSNSISHCSCVSCYSFPLTKESLICAARFVSHSRQSSREVYSDRRYRTETSGTSFVICVSGFLSCFATAFDQTKVYRLAFASIFVPSTTRTDSDRSVLPNRTVFRELIEQLFYNPRSAVRSGTV